MSSFEIRTCRSNKTGSLPEHHDIHLSGDDDSLVTVWAERLLAEFLVEAMDEYEQRKKAGAA